MRIPVAAAAVGLLALTTLPIFAAEHASAAIAWQHDTSRSAAAPAKLDGDTTRIGAIAQNASPPASSDRAIATRSRVPGRARGPALPVPLPTFGFDAGFDGALAQLDALPKPQPGSGAMLLSGLMAVAMIVQRRSSRRGR